MIEDSSNTKLSIIETKKIENGTGSTDSVKQSKEGSDHEEDSTNEAQNANQEQPVIEKETSKIIDG